MNQEHDLPEGSSLAADLDALFRGGGRLESPSEKIGISEAARELMWKFLEPRFNRPPIYSLREQAERFKEDFEAWRANLGSREGASEVTMETMV